MLEYLQHGHVEAPEYNMSCKENHPFPKGSLFLSVCVYELDSNWVDETDGDGVGTHARNLRQLYRIDAPLKLRKELKAEKITASMLSNLGVQGMDPLAFERVTDNFRLATFHIENPYILIPKCSPSVSVTLTVSQVTAWPRAIVVGQSAQVLKRLLYLHKVAAWHQWLSPCSWANLPELDEGRKLLITLPDTGTEGPRSKCKSPVQPDSRPTTASTTASVATQPKLGRPVSTTLPSIDPLPAPPSPKGKALLMKTTKKQAPSPTENANEVFGGVLSWSLLTMTNESQNEGGYLLSVPRGAGERGALVKREIWCVLVDQCFINYVSVDSIKPRVHADLKQYYVTPMAEGIFRIDSDRSASSSFKTLFFMGKNRKEGSRWFWKLYTQSASNSIQKYSSLNFHQGGDASAFVMTRTEGDEVGLGPGFDRKILLDDEDASSLKSGAPGLRTSSELALFRADPMLAFVYESDNGEDKNRESADLNTGTVTRGRNNRGSLLQLMAARRPTFADIVGRSKSCDLADGGGNVDEDKDEDEVFMCSELTDAIAAAVEVTSRSVLHLPLTEEEEGEAEGLGEGEEVVTASVPVPDFNGPINVSASAATSILNSLCTTPRGLSPLQRACRDSRKAWKNRVASDNMSGNGVSKSRLARFAALRSNL